MEQKEARGVLIDVHPCTQEEISVLEIAVRVLRDLSIGNLEIINDVLRVILSPHLPDEKINEICHLISAANGILWRGRSAWFLRDAKLLSLHGLLASALLARLQGNDTEASVFSECRKERELKP